MEIIEIAKKAKEASYILGAMPSWKKDDILRAIADALEDNTEYIIAENKKDIDNAAESRMSKAMLDRLKLDDKRISDMAKGVRDVAALSDPVGETECGFMRPNGLNIIKRRVPLGVIGIIYEARPNVTSDALSLCLKTGNAVILKGGKEAINSNCAIMDVAKKAAFDAGLPKGAIELLRDTSRETTQSMMRLNGYIDVLIPRGGAGLINTVVKNATVPVIQTGVGNCHIYIDENADIYMAKDIIINAKTQRPAVCNAAESLLIHKNIADEFLPVIMKAFKENGVQVMGDENICAVYKDVVLATEEDYAREFLELKISAKIVNDIEEAITHINKFGTQHSECIVTNNYDNANKFQMMVDAAAVYVNASTRFTDGGEFGFGAEIGISTQKLHARGPMGLKELTTYKYLISGNGQVR